MAACLGRCAAESKILYSYRVLNLPFLALGSQASQKIQILRKGVIRCWYSVRMSSSTFVVAPRQRQLGKMLLPVAGCSSWEKLER